MNRAIAWMAENHVAANLLMMLLLVSGLLTIPVIEQEMIPDVELEVVTVTVPYPGASPEDVEEGVCLRVEEAVDGLQGVKRIRSTASEGVGTVMIELQTGEDVARRLADIRARVDAIDNLPVEAERPVVRQAEIGRFVLSIAIAGDADERTLKRLGEQVRDDITAEPGITQATLGSVRPYEVSIEVSEDSLRRYGIRFDDVVAAVRRSSLDLPGGTIKAEGGEILLRARGQAYDGPAFARLPILVRPDGTRLTVGDVARVVDGFEDADRSSFFDGKPAALVSVFQVGDEKMLDIAAAAEAFVAREQARMPEGISVTIWQNSADYLGDRLGNMVSNAKSGFVLVVLVLALFLRLRLALWVSLGIPTAFLGALAVMPALDVSINWISLMGFIVVLGMLVDDAIVVGENTYTEQGKGGSLLEAAIRGTQNIAVPVVFGVATTVAAFAPLLFIPGTMGRLTAVMPTVVIACLVFSLIEAMFVLPAHLGHGKKGLDAPPTNELSRRWREFQDRIAAWLDHVIQRRYLPLLDLAIAQRYMTIAIGISMLLLTLGLIAGGWLKFTFQEPVEGDTISASLTMAPGTPMRVTEAAIRRIEASAREVQAEADAERDPDHGSIFAHMLTSVGIQPSTYQRSQLNPRGGSGSAANLGEVQVELAAPDVREISTSEMQRRWRERVGPVPGAVQLDFSNSMMSAGKPIEVQLEGNDLGELRAAAGELKARLAKYDGVFDIADSFRGGKQELQFRILPEGEAYGLTLADLGRQVRQAFYGDEAQRIQRGRDDVRVVVRYPASERRSLGDIENMRIRAADGTQVPFRTVAQANLGEGYSAIERVDRRRVVAVTGDVDLAVANSNQIVADLKQHVLPELLSGHEGLRYSFEGEQAEQRDFLASMVRGQVIALLLIYALIAIPLRSYLQPVIIMLAIPFGLVGAAIGHLLLGYDFSMYSVIGFVALSGVVVNASLVLVDCVNGLRTKGARLSDAVREATRLRFRAIMLTSLTTFVGLVPMMAQRSVSARFMIPMAISLAFGVAFSSLITLFLIPCACLVAEDVQLLIRGRRDRRRDARRERARAAAQEKSARGELGTGRAPAR